MIKLPLILFSYLGLFLMSLFSIEDIQVDNNLPAMMTPGSRSLVQVTINKGAVQGFSKLELELPTGFTATPVDIKGASFTFSSQKAKFVWMTLPSDANFTITYYLESTPNVEGPFEIEGAFSYVKENKRIDFKIPSKTIILKKGLEPTPEQAAQMLPGVRKEAEVIELVCTRTLSKVSSTEYMVHLKVTNNNIKGFGKILETLPDNCKSEIINDGGAVITQVGNTIKFVWFEVPIATSFEVLYKVLCLSPVGVPAIKGLISYTDEGNPITIEVVQAPYTEDMLATNNTTTQQPTDTLQNNNTTENNTAQSNEPVISNPATADTTVKSVATNTPPKKIESVVTVKKAEPLASNKTDKPQVTSIPSPEKGITYKVQILAAHRVVDKTYFQNKFSFAEKFNIENHEGWVKYTTGGYSEYKDARDARVRITGESAKLPGPFVTAYNDGERVTVQEALLITKQQWYK